MPTKERMCRPFQPRMETILKGFVSFFVDSLFDCSFHHTACMHALGVKSWTNYNQLDKCDMIISSLISKQGALLHLEFVEIEIKPVMGKCKNHQSVGNIVIFRIRLSPNTHFVSNQMELECWD